MEGGDSFRPMVPETAEECMKQLAEKYANDPEKFHREADDLLCSILRIMGFDKTVDIFRNTPKWYA